ncbi:unnamed protein product [Coregonus sp. 'balchen']|nr:unnamed protein product [Coregonus sp. 'balchen']
MKSGDKSTQKEGMGFGNSVLTMRCLKVENISNGRRYETWSNNWKVQHKDFSSQYFTVEKDIALYQKCLLAQKEDELTDLSEQLVGQHQAKDAEKDSFELQLSQLRQEFQENKDKLTLENMVPAGKLAAPEESRVQKEELMAHLKSLEEQLKQRQEHHTLSDKSKQLLEENKDLKEREKLINRELENLEPLFNKVTRKSLGNKKRCGCVFHQLTKCKQKQAELEERGLVHPNPLVQSAWLLCWVTLPEGACFPPTDPPQPGVAPLNPSSDRQG